MRLTSVILYRRVSTRKQFKDGVSLLQQEIEQTAFLSAHQLQTAHGFVDVGSGLKEEQGSTRDGFNKACRLAIKNDMPIVVTTPSRFTRTLEEYDRFIARGGQLIVISLGFDATPEEIRADLKIEIAQHIERQRTSKLGREIAIANGRLPAVPDLRLARQKSVEARKKNALRGYEEFIRHQAAARAEGATSVRDLAVKFNETGFKTPQGWRWKASNVDRVIKTIAAVKAAAAALGAANTSESEGHKLTDLLDDLYLDRELAALEGDENPILSTASPEPEQDESEAEATNEEAQNEEAQAGPKEESDIPEASAGVEVAQAGYALSEAELAEFRALLNASEIAGDDLRKARFIQEAQHPALTREARERVFSWMARRRVSKIAAE